ncbi:MAG TPA: hypothetical protein VHG71_08280 [Verrucomicrobiae bacterium]|nr:hypothetical protein [Verrucomicrobiae bacterium]
MNVLLWRAEYDSHGEGIPVPTDLVWRKILTAPDTSSLTIFQDDQRNGFCELSTSVEQTMATLDEDKPPPEGLIKRAGYQLQFNGSMSFGDFTNRLRFDGRLQFSSTRHWRELKLKLSSRFAIVEIYSLATNQEVRLKIISNGETTERVLHFSDLQNPAAAMRALTGNFGGGLLGELDLPELPQNLSSSSQSIHWEARRDRMKMGHEFISVYRLETQVLQNHIIIYVSTLGEILRVELPGGIVAKIDEWPNS